MNSSTCSLFSSAATLWLTNSEPLSTWKPLTLKGESLDRALQSRDQEPLRHALRGGHELVLRDLVHEIDLVQALPAIQVALMHRVHAQTARLTGQMRLAALPDAHPGRPRLHHRQTAAAVRHGLAKTVRMAVEEPRQTPEPRIAVHLVLTLHRAPRDSAARTARTARTGQGLVDLGQQTDVLLRVATAERTLRTPPPVLDAPGLPVLGDQTCRLSPAESRHLDQEPPHQALVRPRQPQVPGTHQEPPHKGVRIGPLHEPEVDRRAAGHEALSVVKSRTSSSVRSRSMSSCRLISHGTRLHCEGTMPAEAPFTLAPFTPNGLGRLHVR